jgi:mRNA interferase MazF
VVSRQVVIDSRFATVVCAPVFQRRDGLATQVPVGKEDGLPKDGCIHADELVSVPKSALAERVGMLTPPKIEALNQALAVALELPPTLA